MSASNSISRTVSFSRNIATLLILPYPLEGGELRLELRNIPCQLLLHFIGSEFPAGILRRMRAGSLTIQGVDSALHQKVFFAANTLADVVSCIQSRHVIRLQQHLQTVREIRRTCLRTASDKSFHRKKATERYYTLTFDTNGGSKIASVSKASGATIDLTGYVPARAGYDFDGWYSDAKLTNKVTSVKLTKNMTVYAKWTEKRGENPFTDVADDAYYADAVIWAVSKSITSGTTATTFSPNAACTRAQAVTFLWRAAGSPAPQSHAMPFTDVAEGSYYRDAVLWAVENGITGGTAATTFSPNNDCTRAQIVTFLYRCLGDE